MNEAHQLCGSDEWRQMMRDVILPWALGEVDLGDDVLEVGPGYGAATDVLSAVAPQLTSVEIDGELAAMLRRRFAGRPSVRIVQGDATDLGYPDARFSGAVCFTMLHHVPTDELQDRLFGEVARVLRPGAALWPATAWAVPTSPRCTRAIATIPSTRRRCRTACRRPGLTMSR